MTVAQENRERRRLEADREQQRFEMTMGLMQLEQEKLRVEIKCMRLQAKRMEQDLEGLK
jgi:hypothetical protein